MELNEFMIEDEKRNKAVHDVHKKVENMDPKTAAKILSCGDNEKEFAVRMKIIMRAHSDDEFRDVLVKYFAPPYMIKH